LSEKTNPGLLDVNNSSGEEGVVVGVKGTAVNVYTDDT